MKESRQYMKGLAKPSLYLALEMMFRRSFEDNSKEISDWMESSLTLENVKMYFISQHVNVPQYKQGCPAAVKKREIST